MNKTENFIYHIIVQEIKCGFFPYIFGFLLFLHPYIVKKKRCWICWDVDIFILWLFSSVFQLLMRNCALQSLCPVCFSDHISFITNERASNPVWINPLMYSFIVLYEIGESAGESSTSTTTQAAEVKATAQNSIVYTRPERCRRPTQGQPTRKPLYATLSQGLLTNQPFLPHVSTVPLQPFTGHHEMRFETWRFPAGRCQIGRYWSSMKTGPQTPAVTYQTCFLICILYLLPKQQKEHSRLQPLNLTHTSPA